MSIFCFYHHLTGRLEADILTSMVWGKSVKSWRAPMYMLTPIFCHFPSWQAGTTRPGQCGRNSAHISWPAGCRQFSSSATTRGGDNIFRGEHQRGQRGASYCGLCRAKTVRRFFTGLVYCITLFGLIFCLRIYFGASNILSTPIF